MPMVLAHFLGLKGPRNPRSKTCRAERLRRIDELEVDRGPVKSKVMGMGSNGFMVTQ